MRNRTLILLHWWYDAAIILYKEGKYLDAVNRAYFSILSCLRAVLALEAVDFNKHSDIISYFSRNHSGIEIDEGEAKSAIVKAQKI
jgi:uncharacterized protein (UPF0332 family)